MVEDTELGLVFTWGKYDHDLNEIANSSFSQGYQKYRAG